MHVASRQGLEDLQKHMRRCSNVVRTLRALMLCNQEDGQSHVTKRMKLEYAPSSSSWSIELLDDDTGGNEAFAWRGVRKLSDVTLLVLPLEELGRANNCVRESAPLSDGSTAERTRLRSVK